MRIVFFNHKGGVSKTTTTFHLGWKLAQRGSRVLLVDADPQCNLTALMMQGSFEEYYINDQTKTQNLMDGVNSAFKGKPEPIQAITCYTTDRNANLFLIPGHPNLTEHEPALSLAQTAPTAFSTMQNLPGAFNELITATGERYNVDYILIDLNPGLSAINQNLFSISDLFIIPTNPDPFSIMAIKTLANLFPRWYHSANQMKEAFKEASYPFPDKNPKFGGAIIQRFNIRNGKPNKPFRENMAEIMASLLDTLVPNLTRSNMMLSPATYQAANLANDYVIAEIPDFQSLLQKANQIGVPVYALTNEEMNEAGFVANQMQANRQRFDDIFIEFANRLELIKANA